MKSADGTGKLPRVLGPTATLCMIVGSVIGSGIFIVPAKVANQVPAVAGIAFVWIVGGLFSLAGALTLGELGAMLPRAGGPYVYLRAAYGSLPAFLFGWTEFLVIRAGSIATLAAAFGRYFARVVPGPEAMPPVAWESLVAVIAIATLAVLNSIGTRVGGGVQIAGTILKLGALIVMMILPFALGKASASRLSPVWPRTYDKALFQGIMVAMVGVLWAYDGWVNVSSLGEEIEDPGRSIPRSLIRGMLILIGTYLGMTLVYHLVLSMDEIRSLADKQGISNLVAADFCRTLMGPRGETAIALVVTGSIFIALNGNALAGPRAYFAMARDGLFPHWLCRIHPRFQTPANAIMAQAGWAILLTVLGTYFSLKPAPSGPGLPEPVRAAWAKLHETPLYDVLYTYVIFGGTVLYTMTVAGVFVLRARHPEWPRPYRTWGYPVTPLIYIGASCLLMYSMLTNTPAESLAGLGIIALGVPVYGLFFAGTAKNAEVLE